MEQRHVLLVGLAVAVLLAGCAATGGGDGAMESGDAVAASGGDAGAPDGGAGDGGDGGRPSEQVATGNGVRTDRAIIRTGEVTLRAADFDATRAAVVEHARSLDGYVSGSGSTRHSRDNESWTTGYVVLQVPSGQFGGALSFVRERGTVLDAETETEDVTDQLIDPEARLTNLRERRDRLRSFYERANTTEALLDVEAELSEVQSQIEQLEAQKRSLERRVAFSTLRVEIREPAPDYTAASASLVGTLRRSTATFVDSAYGTLLFGVRLAPYLLFVGIPALLAGHLLRRRYRPFSRLSGGDSPDERSGPVREVSGRNDLGGDAGHRGGDDPGGDSTDRDGTDPTDRPDGGD